MKHFKKELENVIEILIQLLWLNKHITMNNDHICYKKYENKGITYVKDILNNNCEFVDYIINGKYDIGTFFLDIMQLKSSIPIEWKQTFKQCCQMPKTFHLEISLKLTTHSKE